MTYRYAEARFCSRLTCPRVSLKRILLSPTPPSRALKLGPRVFSSPDLLHMQMSATISQQLLQV